MCFFFQNFKTTNFLLLPPGNLDIFESNLFFFKEGFDVGKYTRLH